MGGVMRFVLLLAVFAISCGKKGSGASDSPAAQQPAIPTTSPSTSMLVDTKAGLPGCDSTRGGQLAYVKGESKFYGCDGTAWGEINIKGEAGTAGSDNSVTTSYYCHQHLTANVGVDYTHYYIYYWATETKSGDVFVTASVNGDAAGISASKVYGKNQTGATRGEILVQDDAYGSQDGGYWTIDLDRVGLTGNIKNYDTMAGGYRIFSFATTDCTKTTN